MDDNQRIDTLYEQGRKSMALSYLLWLVLGAFGAHRFYNGATRSAVIQLVLTLTGVGLVIVIPWLLIDLFLIPGLVNDKNREILDLLTSDPAPAAGAETAPPPQALPPREAELDSRRKAMLDDLRETGYRKPERARHPLLR
ncbi:TM2 domain-containing protein [Qipengyuania nanhaisediminis]|uniref:TM2 domain-containing protein n=1 Tax=Qipengyuania nanhaisediminis TaxID=604088 RepID=UPI0038B314C0